MFVLKRRATPRSKLILTLVPYTTLVRSTTDTLEKVTWILISAIVVMSVVASGFSKTTKGYQVSEISGQMDEGVIEQAAPQTINFEDGVTTNEENN